MNFQNPKHTIDFVWLQGESSWEIREMMGKYAYQIRGFIRLANDVWVIDFENGEKWIAELSDLLGAFDMADRYLNNDPTYLESLTVT